MCVRCCVLLYGGVLTLRCAATPDVDTLCPPRCTSCSCSKCKVVKEKCREPPCTKLERVHPSSGRVDLLEAGLVVAGVRIRLDNFCRAVRHAHLLGKVALEGDGKELLGDGLPEVVGGGGPEAVNQSCPPDCKHQSASKKTWKALGFAPHSAYCFQHGGHSAESRVQNGPKRKQCRSCRTSC